MLKNSEEFVIILDLSCQKEQKISYKKVTSSSQKYIKPFLFGEVYKNKIVDRAILIKNHHDRISEKCWYKISRFGNFFFF